MISIDSEPLYRKVQHGKRVRYEVATHHIYDLHNMPAGIHMVVVHGEGGRSYRYNVDPDHAAVLGLMPTMRDAMVAAMRSQNQYSLDNTQGKPLTKKQRAALDEYQRLRSDDLTVFKGVSMWDVVAAGLKVLEDALIASKG